MKTIARKRPLRSGKEDKRVYIARSSYSGRVDIWPAVVGIRKFRGCIEYGSAWASDHRTHALYKESFICSSSEQWRGGCIDRYGVYPAAGEAYYWNGKKAVKVELEFSN
ncbi:hypothetical protein LCGC14_2037580 [marine sediment metagenome]|uniref:Uncharacterized protein n=1 Tax=marine sediment metagenome TaxID=412755 RepID=A0A0F9HPX3_9ZZZZ